MADGFARTPRYVLRNGILPFCPTVLSASIDVPVTVIFGFTDKPEYDLFLKNSSLALTPYPLVKGYLKNQLEQNVDSLKLVALDAVSPRELVLRAATMQAVYESIQHNSDSVAVSHQLILEESLPNYRVQILEVVTR